MLGIYETRRAYATWEVKSHHFQTPRSWSRPPDAQGNRHLEDWLLTVWWESEECCASGESPFSIRKVFSGKFLGSCNSSAAVLFWDTLFWGKWTKKEAVWILVLRLQTKIQKDWETSSRGTFLLWPPVYLFPLKSVINLL